jgi:hypothetical protein
MYPINYGGSLKPVLEVVTHIVSHCIVKIKFVSTFYNVQKYLRDLANFVKAYDYPRECPWRHFNHRSRAFATVRV